MNGFKEEDLGKAAVGYNLDPCQNSLEDMRNLWNHFGRWHSLLDWASLDVTLYLGLDHLGH